MQYQLAQIAPLEIEARLVVERPLTGPEERALIGLMREALGAEFLIAPRYITGRLPAGPSGKFDEFVCLL